MSVSMLMAVALAQTAPAAPPPVPPGPLDVTVPVVEGVAADATCGGRTQLATIATCVSTTQAAIEGVLNTWTAAFQTQGWLAAGGSENRVVYVRRRPQGGCDGFQVMAFTDSVVAAPAAPAYLAMAAVPGDVCAGQAAAAPSAPVAPQ